MSEPLEAAAAKIERAKKHIEDLKRAERMFLDGQPYGFRIHIDPQGGYRSVSVIVRAEVPLRVGAVMGDVLHNLRSSLDYLAWELFRLSNPGDSGYHVYFPVCWDPPGTPGYESAFNGKVKGIAGPAITVLDSLQLYQVRQSGGDYTREALYVLNDLERRDKHHTLHLVGGALLGMQVLSLLPPDNPKYTQIGSVSGKVLGIAENGAELLRFPLDLNPAEANMDIEAIFRVVIEEVRPGEYEPVVPLALELTQFVEGVLQRLRPLFP